MQRILVIEDENDIRQLLRFNLEREGFAVLEAADGLGGLHMATSELPDLVVLDLMLPGMDGCDVCRRLKAQPVTAAIPVLMLIYPPAIALIILAFISSWNEYMAPLIFLVKKELYTVSQNIQWYMLDEFKEHNLTMAAATSAIVPVVILFIVGQKYFVEGIATSGVKG